MTTVVQTPFNEHTGNGVTTTFGYTFQLLDEDDLKVYVDEALVASSEYTVSGVGMQAGGDVVFDVAPASSAAVLLSRELALARAIDYQTNGDLPSDTLDEDMDRAWQALQQLDANINGVLRAPYPETLGDLPAAADRASLFLAFDGDGEPIASAGPVEGVPVSTFMETLLDDTTADAAQTTLGGTAAGKAVFTAASATAAFDAIKQAATEAASGVVELATSAETAALTDTARAIVPANLTAGVKAVLGASGSAPVFGARAWVNFDGTGTVAIRGSGNVSSITDNGTGDYTVNFTTAMADANYAVIPMSELDESSTRNNHIQVNIQARAAGSVRILTSSSAAAAQDHPLICLAIFR